MQYEKDIFEASEELILGHFTSSIFLESILNEGLLPPSKTNKYSNFHDAQPGDENYIYLITHYDSFFAQKAVEKYGGEEIVIMVRVKKETLELDNFNNVYTHWRGVQNFNPRDSNQLYRTLAGDDTFSQCKTSISINPEQILEIYKVNELYNHSFIKRNYNPLPYTLLTDYLKRHEILTPSINPLFKRGVSQIVSK